ncbi:hypothetical protein BT93_B1399 [Corymbia citriodora subsp. variegata]|nr:hypothetical protein BT93_B1399 [Corymbia citriodora subsp. variegata]
MVLEGASEARQMPPRGAEMLTACSPPIRLGTRGVHEMSGQSRVKVRNFMLEQLEPKSLERYDALINTHFRIAGPSKS